MKLSRALTAIVLVASISATGVMVAHASTPASGPLGLERRALREATSIESSRLAGTGAAAPAKLVHSARPTSPKRVIIRFKDSPTRSVLTAAAHSADASSSKVRKLAHEQFTWSVPAGRSAEEFAAQLQASGKVEYAVPDYERELAVAYTPPAYAAPNDPDYLYALADHWATDGRPGLYEPGRSWWLHNINAAQSWQEGYTGEDIVGKYPLRAGGSQFVVAVIDTGLYVHPDNQTNVVGGRDFFEKAVYRPATDEWIITQDDDVTPALVSEDAIEVLDASHGTCVSGEIGATANNNAGTIGVGYDTRVIVHKVRGFVPGGAAIADSAVANAIYYSVDINHARVINMSLGGDQYSRALADAINYAYSHGCVVVAAKGNHNSNLPYYPASNKHVVSVGALDKNLGGFTVPALYTNYAKTPLDIMAPGSAVWGFSNPQYAIPSDVAGEYYPPGYYLWDGTSMAAPVVSGAIAWLWRAAPKLTNAEITSEVLNSAPRGPSSTRFPSGYRRLDIYATYTRLKTDFPLLTKPVIQQPTLASLGSVPVTWSIPLNKLRGVTYQWWGDTDQHGSTTSNRAVLPWTSGDHYFEVKASSSYNWDDGTADSDAMLHIVRPADGTTTWQSAHVAGSSATVATPAYRVATPMDAAMVDASSTALSGAIVRLQSSTDGTHFADVPGVVATNVQAGDYRCSAPAPTSRRWYRFSFVGTGTVQPSVSSAVRIVPGVSLTTPYSKSTISHVNKLSVSGKLMPSHASSSRTVKIKIKRWNGAKWADYSWIWARVTRQNSSYATYAVKFRLKKGGYRLYAYAPADIQHSATTSSYRSVTVK